MPSYDDLFQICAKYTGDKYYVDEVIPEKKLANARKHFPIPPVERVVALIDATVFGSAKTGLAISEEGIRWHNGSNNNAKGPKSVFLPWDKFASAPINYRGMINISVQIGEGTEFDMPSQAMNKKNLVQLLSEIQSLIGSAPTISGRSQWMLAISGQQFGPYDLSTIREMIVGRQIDPEECWAWREGMSGWVRFNQVPALTTLLHELTHRPQRTPPPLPTFAPPVPVGSQTREGLLQTPVHPDTSGTSERFGSQTDLNHAAVDDLLALPGLTLPHSRKLVRERDSRGGFRTVEEVGHLLGFQPHQTERLKERALVTPYKGSRPSAGRVVDF